MRAEFTKSTKAAAFLRANGRCECGCGSRVTPGEVQYDHWPVPAALGGSNEVSNCRVLRTKCHRQITATKDVPAISKSARIADKARGLRTTKRKFVSRANPWGKDMSNA